MKQLSHTSKIFLIPSLVFAICSCGNNAQLPEDVDNFFHELNYNKAFESTKGGVFHEDYFERDSDGNIYSSHTIDFSFAYLKDNDFSFVASYRFSGDQAKEYRDRDLVMSVDYAGKFSLVKYFYDTNETTIEALDYDTALSYYTRIFYSQWTGYPIGGLYYGDYFINQFKKIKNIYQIDEQNKIMSFSYQNDTSSKGYLMSQSMAINHLGMLISSSTVLENTKTKSVGTIIQAANYKIK